ncbi:CatB-related O-acetyltransferase [Planktotalea sp.]|uniref:CatB-related O-acetyltransferase n=1 Tax=Planktotalea sp. TaxID=2029877 RepID=UPI003296DBB1
MTKYPAPTTRNPVRLPDGTSHQGTVFLAAAVQHARFEVGAYTYASAHQPPEDWAAHLAPYLYDSSPEKLKIGKFCQIANGVQFITASANHRYDGISSYPFAIFDDGPLQGRPSIPEGGRDTIVGHDCWIGAGATILPGATLGDGVIVGAGAVVAGDIPDYHIVVGNPAQKVRQRFSDQQISRLKRISWWDWPIDKILRHETEICGADIDALEQVAQ